MPIVKYLGRLSRFNILRPALPACDGNSEPMRHPALRELSTSIWLVSIESKRRCKLLTVERRRLISHLNIFGSLFWLMKPSSSMTTIENFTHENASEEKAN